MIPDTATPYDDTPYPTAIFVQTHPDRMATVATLAGLSPPDIATARILEIGAGDAMNLIALATAYPRAHFTAFDLAPTAVARGRHWAAACGLSNIRIEVMNILDAADALDGDFDYIIAHGVYAWVPPDVREATMALIGRKLSANGVAFVSYNAMPGGYLRLALRDALLLALDGIEEPRARLAAARVHLKVLAEGDGGPENPFQMALRDAAKKSVDKAWAVLSHDELGPHFHPQSLVAVVAAAKANGLGFLGEADRELIANTFLPDEVTPDNDPDAQVVRLNQGQDYRDIRFFRHTLLVRDSARPARRIDHAALGRLYASTRCRREGDTHFTLDAHSFEVRDDALNAALGRMVDERPARILIDDLVDTEPRRLALFEMFDLGLIDLNTQPPPYRSDPGDYPAVSPLVRLMIADHMQTICTLDHRLMAISEFGPRHLMAHLDGTRDLAALREAGREAGLEDDAALLRGLQMLARECVLVP